MANPEHLEILKQGVEIWNQWRRDNKIIKPDLSVANLTGTNLRGADFSDVNLSAANLSEANLSEANLIRADLSRANLSKANLSKIDIRRANLIRADLSNADLRGTNLYYTIFGNTNLSKAKNLDTCYHIGPSIIDQMTLVHSGKLSENFLRGCGLSDDFIAQIPFLFWEKQSFEFYSCFISYGPAKKITKRLHITPSLRANTLSANTPPSGRWCRSPIFRIPDHTRRRVSDKVRCPG